MIEEIYIKTSDGFDYAFNGHLVAKIIKSELTGNAFDDFKLFEIYKVYRAKNYLKEEGADLSGADLRGATGLGSTNGTPSDFNKAIREDK